MNITACRASGLTPTQLTKAVSAHTSGNQPRPQLQSMLAAEDRASKQLQARASGLHHSLAKQTIDAFAMQSPLRNGTSPPDVGVASKAALALAVAGSPAIGPPVLMSFPHFCYVDDDVAHMTEGLECNHSRHDLWLGVEPTTGITMAAAKRLQVPKLHLLQVHRLWPASICKCFVSS